MGIIFFLLLFVFSFFLSFFSVKSHIMISGFIKKINDKSLSNEDKKDLFLSLETAIIFLPICTIAMVTFILSFFLKAITLKYIVITSTVFIITSVHSFFSRNDFNIFFQTVCFLCATLSIINIKNNLIGYDFFPYIWLLYSIFFIIYTNSMRFLISRCAGRITDFALPLWILIHSLTMSFIGLSLQLSFLPIYSLIIASSLSGYFIAIYVYCKFLLEERDIFCSPLIFYLYSLWILSCLCMEKSIPCYSPLIFNIVSHILLIIFCTFSKALNTKRYA